MTSTMQEQPRAAQARSYAAGQIERPGTHSEQGGQGEPRWLDEEQQRHWRAYLLGAARLNDALNRQLEADSGLSIGEYEVLVRLSESPERTARMSELADSLVHSRSRLTHTVSRMQRRGLVERRTCLVDGRGVNCVMTDAGMALLAAAAPGHVRAVRTHLVDLLTDEQFRVLGEAMAAIVRGTDGDRAPA